MERFNIVENIANELENADQDSKILFGRRIYQRFAHTMIDKNDGVNIKINDMPCKFLSELLCILKNQPDEPQFWETL